MCQLRGGKVSAALAKWEEALALDEGLTTARSYIDYIKKNRIRIAVHLGRTPPRDDDPIDIPEGWPEPPAGLCDPVPQEEAGDAEADVAPMSRRPAPKSSGNLPYAEMELTGTSRPRLSDVLAKGKKKPSSEAAPETAPKAPPAPRPPARTTRSASTPGHNSPTRSPTGDEYLTMEIVVEDDEPPPDPRNLPPPPEALAAPETIIEAPGQDAGEDEPQDYLYDRTSSDQLESVSLEHLAGKDELSGSTPPPPPATPPTIGDEMEAPDDLPTQARDHTPSGTDLPAAEPAKPTAGEGSMDLPQAPRVATTFDDVVTNLRGDPNAFSQQPPAGLGEPSPYSTLAGLGPRVLFAEFGDKDLQGEAPPLDFAPPAGEDPAPGSPTPQTLDDYVRDPGSFSEDAPTRALDPLARPPGLRLDAPQDLDREEGSFSDSLPTRARPSTVQAGAGVIDEPRDFTYEGSFSDDIPTTARPKMGGGEAGIRAIPLDQDHGREGSFSDDLVTLARSGVHQEERLSEEMEVLLQPDRGLAMAKQFFEAGEHERSLELTELLQRRYPTLKGISDLLEANRNALEATLLAKLGDLASIPVPQTADLGQDNQELDPRAAFLFSRIDGTLSLQDIIDISGMSQYETARILLLLREIGLLDFEPPR